MIDREIKTTLNQFKRIYVNQIQPKGEVFSSETSQLLKRHSLGKLSSQKLKKLSRTIIKEIDQHQKVRKQKHQGLVLFKQHLQALLKDPIIN